MLRQVYASTTFHLNETGFGKLSQFLMHNVNILFSFPYIYSDLSRTGHYFQYYQISRKKIDIILSNSMLEGAQTGSRCLKTQLMQWYIEKKIVRKTKQDLPGDTMPCKTFNSFFQQNEREYQVEICRSYPNCALMLLGLFRLRVLMYIISRRLQ